MGKLKDCGAWADVMSRYLGVALRGIPNITFLANYMDEPAVLPRDSIVSPSDSGDKFLWSSGPRCRICAQKSAEPLQPRRKGGSLASCATSRGGRTYAHTPSSGRLTVISPRPRARSISPVPYPSSPAPCRAPLARSCSRRQATRGPSSPTASGGTGRGDARLPRCTGREAIPGATRTTRHGGVTTSKGWCYWPWAPTKGQSSPTSARRAAGTVGSPSQRRASISRCTTSL